MANAQRDYHWDLRPRELDVLKKEAGVKEELAGRTAGAVSLALGMAKVLANLPGMKPLIAYLYHFVIMFEALFILTLLETGTRVLRFILQELLTQFRRPTEREPRDSLDDEHCDQPAGLRCLGLPALPV